MKLSQELSQLLIRARDENELAVLLEGVLTPQELEEVVERCRLLTRLLAGQKQREIAKDLGVSLGKISRGSRLLQYGSPHFREALRRITRELEDDTDER